MKIQLKLMLVIIPIIIAIISIISVTTGILTRSALKNQTHENAQLLSRIYADQLNSTIKLYQNISLDLGSASITAINIETTLQVFRKRYPQFSHVFYTTTTGSVREISPFMNDLLDYSMIKTEGWLTSLESMKPEVSPPGVYFNEKSIIFFAPAVYSYIEHQKPRVEGMVALVLPLKELFRHIGEIRTNKSDSLFVLNEKGIVIHHENREMILRNKKENSNPNDGLIPIIEAMENQKSGFGTYENGNRYISFCPISSMRWSLGLFGSYSEITSEIDKITKIILFVMSLGIILAAITLYFAVHSVIAPIEELTIKAGDIGKGNFHKKIPMEGFAYKKKTNNEVSKLIYAFNKMTGQLDQTFLNLNNEISERKSIEAALDKTQKYLNNIVESMPSMLISVDSSGNITHWNKATENITGISTGRALGTTLGKTLPYLEKDVKKILESIRSGTVIHIKKKLHKLLDSDHFEDITIYPLKGINSEEAVIRIDDISEKVRLEEMMIQSEKMLSIGGLAAGMAHEINNPLAGMIQTASVMENRLSTRLNMPANVKVVEKLNISMDTISLFMEERGIFRMLKSISESGERIAGIVENMLSFSRKSDREFSSKNLSELLEKTIELAETDYNLKKQNDFKKIEILRDYEASLPLVLCEASKIQQVLLNLLRNGAQAMQESETESPCFTIRLFHKKEDKMVSIEVEDNGPGMDEEHQKRIFDPFFTTKPIGVGTGLGLSVSYFIITEHHNGTLSVQSTKGIGSIFTICLPAG